MSAVLYYLILIPISLLPFRILYFLSDFFYLILYYVIPYRKKVVLMNLKNSFPHKSDKEIEAIAQKFYSHFCDLIIESIKTFTISENELRKRMRYTNAEILDKYFANKRSIIAITAHYNSWEWGAISSSFYLKHKPFGIYKPLADKFLDQKLRKSRERFGIAMFPMKETKEYLTKYSNIPIMTGFVSDQSPSKIANSHWVKFLNQDTAASFGAEKYAKDFDSIPVFCNIQKIKRGYYETTFSVVSENPKDEPHGKITEVSFQILEKIIQEKPEFWVWSHKRWKHKRPKNFESV